MLIRSIRSCSARQKVYGDKMQLVSLSTGVSIYIKLKFRHLVALSPSKRIYAILCKWNLVSGIISVWQSLPFEKKVSAQKNCTRLLMLCYLHLKKYTLFHRHSLCLHGLDVEDEDPPQLMLPCCVDAWSSYAFLFFSFCLSFLCWVYIIFCMPCL